MTAIALFGAFENQDIRWNQDLDNPWWVGMDICAALEIANHRDALAGLDDDERDGVGIPDSIGRVQQTIVINEAGVYRLIFKSRTQKAKQFQRWVFHEVLPSIRKTGSYGTELQDPFDHPDIQAFLELLMNADLRLSELRMLCLLYLIRNETDPFTYAKLGARLNVGRATAYRAVKQLEAAGLA